MAKAVTERAFPAPPDAIRITTTVLPAGSRLFRLHHARYAADQFNDSAAGDARFSPLRDRDTHQIIPTLYAGDSSDVALCEVLLHDIDVTRPQIVFDQRRLAESWHSEISFAQDLRVALLDHASLIKMRAGKRLIHCDAADYLHTRLWAEHIYKQHQNLQGMEWPSRQYQGRAWVFFGDRIAAGVCQVAKSTRLLRDKNVTETFLSLADRMEITII